MDGYPCCAHCEHAEDEAEDGHPVDCIYCQDKARLATWTTSRVSLGTAGRS